MISQKPVLKALRSLLKFKGEASYAEIAKVAVVKTAICLEILNDNKRFWTLGKNKKISSISPLVEAARKEVWKTGKFFQERMLNPGGAKEIIINMGDNGSWCEQKRFDELKLDIYVYGGDGRDVGPYSYIEHTPENIQKLNNFGLTSTLGSIYSQKLENEIQKFWKENPI